MNGRLDVTQIWSETLPARKGDVFVAPEDGILSGLPVGSEGQVLAVSADGLPYWTSSNVMPGGDLSVTGNALISGTLGVTGNTTVENITATGNGAVSGNLILTGALGVTGATTLHGAATVAGAATLTGGLGVTGSATISSGGLGVTGTTTLNNALNVIGNTVLTGTLGVTGAITAHSLIFPQQHATSGAPAYQKGALYFDTTLNKLRVGGASDWETVTSV